jgi:hypothetical protein
MYTGHTMKSEGQNSDHYGLGMWVARGRKPNFWADNINNIARQSLIFFRLIYSFNWRHFTSQLHSLYILWTNFN